MQIRAEPRKSALPICNYSQILYQFLTFTQNLKRSRLWTHAFTICFFNITVYVQYQQNNITIYFKDGKKSICTVTNDTLNKFTQLSQQILPSKAWINPAWDAIHSVTLLFRTDVISAESVDICSTNRAIRLCSACYYEEPYAGKPHVRICEGLRLRGLSLLDSRADSRNAL